MSHILCHVTKKSKIHFFLNVKIPPRYHVVHILNRLSNISPSLYNTYTISVRREPKKTKNLIVVICRIYKTRRYINLHTHIPTNNVHRFIIFSSIFHLTLTVFLAQNRLFSLHSQVRNVESEEEKKLYVSFYNKQFSCSVSVEWLTHCTKKAVNGIKTRFPHVCSFSLKHFTHSGTVLGP
jgi:hypothetical protein